MLRNSRLDLAKLQLAPVVCPPPPAPSCYKLLMFLVFSLLFIFIHVVILLVPLSRYQNFQRSVSNMLIWNMLTVGILFLSFTFSLVSRLLLLCSYLFMPSPFSLVLPLNYRKLSARSCLLPCFSPPWVCFLPLALIPTKQLMIMLMCYC